MLPGAAEQQPAVSAASGRTRRFARLVGRIPPYSSKALGIGIACFLAALAVQMGFRWLGGSLPFVTYFPAVLIAGLLGGLPCGLLVVLLASTTVWWAVMTPAYHFFPLSPAEQMDLIAFVLASGCVLVVSELYRASLVQLRNHEEERALILKELEHRGRNTYAVIDAIIQRTFEDQPERASIASGRIRAVKYANDLLTEAVSHAVLLKSLLLHEFVPYGEERFHAHGPDVELAPDAARHLALVFHELVTNAAKHGGLATPQGRVRVSWEIAEGEVKLDWREEGGPVVSAPKGHGFGSRVVTQSLRSMSGSIVPTFAPEGLRCAMTFRV
ncbi:MAG: sensor histidine kinase [Xanthobacteraceae bacterium]